MKSLAFAASFLLVAVASAPACSSAPLLVGRIADASVDAEAVPETGASVDADVGDGGVLTAPADGPSDATTQCGWPASLDDAGPWGCHAARAYVSCLLPSGGGCFCLSNDPTQCTPGCGAPCKDQCAANEYAVACGGIGPPPPDAGNVDQPPSGCRSLPPNPGGIAYSCCPCTPGGKDSEADVSGRAFCVDAGPVANCTDADIQASNYDQTCQTDSDCILVGEGQSCYPCSLAYGPFGAIGRGALPQFEADVAKTPGGSTMGGVSCAPSCGTAVLACCRGGRCHADISCSADARDASAE